MDVYNIILKDGWDVNFRSFDKPIQDRIMKKILQLRHSNTARHLQHGFQFFVHEVGSYRIAFENYEREKTRRIIFVGTHKQYEKWYSSL